MKRLSRAAPQKSWKERAYEVLIVRSWWMLLFIMIAYAAYAYAMHKKQRVYTELQSRLSHLEQEKQRLLSEQEDLTLHLKSQNDPAWIEMTLKKELGLVPEGQTKVFFNDEIDDE